MTKEFGPWERCINCNKGRNTKTGRYVELGPRRKKLCTGCLEELYFSAVSDLDELCNLVEKVNP